MELLPSRKVRLYSPLPAQHTRLAQASFDDDGSLIVRLHLVDLNKDSLDYEAISYTWGDRAQLCALDVFAPNGTKYTIQVTQSAITAITDVLRYCSPSEGSGLYLWIDQICIDQSSNSEKIEQIQMIKKIYSKASMVFAWLGSSSEESDVGMAHITRLFSQVKDKTFLPVNGATAEAPDCEAVLGSADDLENAKRWQGVLHVLCRPYFLRGWILQEATALNSDFTVVICGKQAAPLSCFIRVTIFLLALSMRDLNGELPAFRYLCEHYKHLRPLTSFSDMRKHRNGEPLVLLARRLRRCNVTDPRDRLACMLSFATDISDPDHRYQLDYSLPFQTIYTHFAMWSICKYSNLDIFGHVAGVHAQNQDIPSWVPDWSVGGKVTFVHREQERDPCSPPLYAASGRYMSDIRVQLPLPSSPSILKASGVYLSYLWETVPFYTERDGVWRYRNLDFSRFFCELNDCSMTEVFERTKLADITVRLDEPTQGGLVFGRTGRVELPQQAEFYFNNRRIDDTCAGRALFLVHDPSDSNRVLMGICPDHAQRGDEIWMLKGGKMLYILRPRDDLPAGEEVIFDTTGGEHGLTEFPTKSSRFELVGEAFMLGLMDGEIVDMMGDNPLRKPPPQFRHMDKEFSSVYLV